MSHSGIGHLRSESGRKLELGPQTPGGPGAGAKAHPKGGREPHKGASPPTGESLTQGPTGRRARGPEPPGRPHPDKGRPQHATHPSQGGGATGDPDPERPTRTEAQHATPTRPAKKREQDNKIETKEPIATVTTCKLGQITHWEP